MKLKKGQVVGKPAAFVSALRSLDIPEEEWNDGALDLHNTAHRMMKMLREEMLSSYKPGSLEDLRRRFTCFPSDGQDAMVVLGPIDFHSLCAHHMLPFSGNAFVGYIPGAKVMGASKMPRVVNHFAHMLQIQERMTRQIADFLMEHAEPGMVIVLCRAAHLCMTCRGVKQQNARMVTTAIRPAPGENEDRLLRYVLDEFYAQIALLT